MKVIPLLIFCMIAFSCLTEGNQQSQMVDLAKAPEACSLLNREQAEKIAGESLVDPTPQKGAASDKVKMSQCTFASTNGMKTMTLSLRLTNAGDNNPDYAKQTMKDSGAIVEDVTGIGDSAFWTMMQLQAFKGTHIQIVVSIFGFDSAKEKASEVAKKSLEQLSSAGL